METTCRTENICKLLRTKRGAAITTRAEGREGGSGDPGASRSRDDLLVQPHTPHPPLRRDFGDGAVQPFMSERISHSHSLEQKRLKGSPVRCFPLLISKSSLKEHSPPGGGSGRLGDDGESRRRGSALARSSLLQAAPHQPSEPQARHQHPHVPWPAAPAARRARPGSRGAGGK